MDVAVKEFYPKDIAVRTDGAVGARDESFVSVYANRLENFCSEAKLLTELAGTPGIPSIRDAFKFKGTAYIVTNYTVGKSLSEYLDGKGGRIGWVETASILTPAAEALKTLHDKGVIHKDISPSNILVTDNGGVLLDFGSAASSERTLKHGYAPIELYSNNVPAGASADIYSLAAAAYKCLTGITPVQAADRVVNDTLQLPSSAGSDISPEEEALLMKALAVRPGDRISDDDLIGLFRMRQTSKTQPIPAQTAARSESTAQAASQIKTAAPASADGHTIVVPAEYTGQSIMDGEVTVVMDCSELRDYSEPEPLQPQINVDMEKASAALKESGEKLGKAAGVAGEQLGRVAGQVSAKVSETVKSDPAKFKKIAAAAVALLVILAGGYAYYNNIYLNSFGVQYGKSLDMYDDGNYRASFNQLNQTVYLHPDPNEKQMKDINYLVMLLMFRGHPVEDDDFLGTLPGPEGSVWDFAFKYGDEGDLRYMKVIAESCAVGGTLEWREGNFAEVGFDRLKKYVDAIAEKDPDYGYLRDLNGNVSQRLFIITMDKLDKSILDEAIEYMKKSGASDAECARAREKYEGMIEWHQDYRKEIEERKRKQREADRKAKLEHEARLREQKEKDRIAAEENRKAREERKRQEAAAKKENQKKQQQQPEKTQQAQQPQNISGMTLAQKITAVRKAMAQRDAAEQARLRKRAEEEAASRGISVNDALMILLGIGR